MEALWGWCWRRFGRRYSWATFVAAFVTIVPPNLLWCGTVLGVEGWERYGLAVAGTVGTVAVAAAVCVLPGSSAWNDLERWAADDGNVSAAAALESTYGITRRAFVRAVTTWPVLYGVVGAIGANVIVAETSRALQYGLVAATIGLAFAFGGGHFWFEAALRPARLALAGGSDIGDRLPRTRPSFGTWSTTVTMTQVVLLTMGGALGGVVMDVETNPAFAVPIAFSCAALSVVIVVTTIIGPGLAPLRDLAAGTERVAAGDFTVRIPVVQDDDLGALAASFNRMQSGLAERERLHSAFGSYVDPALARRLLAQGDDVFAGERVEVTVMFVDIRDFTAFAEANTAEDTVAHLNSLFEIVVDAADAHGGHVNKFLGDGAMVVFGAPEFLDDHADRALGCAAEIDHCVAERFHGAIRIGIGINSGTVIAGTIGAAKKREFTLIGDTVNVASRVEQLTKTTGDAVLITQAVLDAATTHPHVVNHRGAHELKGKARPVTVHALGVASTDSV